MTRARWSAGSRTSQLVRSAAYLLTLGVFVGALLQIFGGSPPLSPDRGDFYRVGRPSGIVVPAPDPSHPRRVTEYALGPVPAWDRTMTSAALVATLARGLRFLSGVPQGFLDIRQIGLLHVALGAVPLVLAFAVGLSPALGLLFAWVAFDPARLALCMSLLTEPPGLMGIAGVAALLAASPGNRAPWSPAGRTIALVTLAMLAGFSRTPLSLVPLSFLAVAACFDVFPRRRGPSPPRGVVLWVFAAAVAVIPPAYFSSGDVPRFWTINAYHSVFLGVADVSSEPERVLDTFAIRRPYGSRIGSSYFDQPVPKDLENSLARVSRLRIAVAYAREPRAILRAAERLQIPLARERVPGESNDSRASMFAASSVHSRVFGAWPPLVWLAAVGSAIFCFRRKSPVRAASAFLAITFATQLVIVVLGDGFFALGRHLAPARLCLDLLCILALVDVTCLVVTRFARGTMRTESGGPP